MMCSRLLQAKAQGNAGRGEFIRPGNQAKANKFAPTFNAGSGPPFGAGDALQSPPSGEGLHSTALRGDTDWDSFAGLYRVTLLACLRWRWLVVLVLALVAGAAWWLFKTLPAELSPVEDRGVIFAVVSAPEGATIDYTDAYARQIESFLAPIPEIETYFVVVAPGLEPPNPVNSAIAFVIMKPWGERQRSQQQVAGRFFGEGRAVPQLG